ncbi:hypothetical protein GQ55_3G240900 [Panicum hallii var. hallii]|uniref:Uncharacterized protein n=1 Tax=Panicum hallii var. hallii TaxID=1504633 RepID=A0A2T7ECT5_9POAL|nr:hypothetical protein GQ55_3G240900 [Panicum hallii var. hallii]
MPRLCGKMTLGRSRGRRGSDRASSRRSHLDHALTPAAADATGDRPRRWRPNPHPVPPLPLPGCFPPHSHPRKP